MNALQILRRRVGRLVAPLLTGFLLSSCGVEFDSIGQLEGLRVLGVQKDIPVAKPGDTVNYRMVVNDTGDAKGRPRSLSFLWLAGCKNPPADAYQGCLIGFSQVASQLSALLELDPDQVDPAELSSIGSQLAEAGVTFGFEETFQAKVDEDIISNKPPSPVPAAAPYGVSIVFFAACAGQLRPDPESSGFPVACFDDNGERLGARDFVAGYTSVYAYLDQQNSLPVITGMRVAGKEVARSAVCINDECETLEPDPKRKCASDAPKIKRCASGTLRQSCPDLEVAVTVDPASVDQDAPLSLGGDGAPEPMWVNYHTDRGSFTNDVSLINDIEAGFRDNPKTKYLASEEPGPAMVWAAVRDNRGGFAWARTSICVE